MKAGAYKLKIDITNLYADGRVKDDWRYAKTWKAGTIFYVLEREMPTDFLKELGVDKPITYFEVACGQREYRQQADALPKLFWDNIEPWQPDNIISALKAAGIDYTLLSHAIDVLISEGKLTQQDVIDAVKRIPPDED